MRLLRRRVRVDRRCRYDSGIKQRAVVLLEQGCGRKRLASALGIPLSTAREWVMTYRSGGAESLFNMGARYKRFSAETKRAAVYEHLVEGVSLADLMAKYGINDTSTLKKWCRAYGKDLVRDEA